MKKLVKKTESPIQFRYEFSDESGRPEGGDIFQFTSLKSLQKMMGEVLAVAQTDGVTVAFAIGQGENFFNYLKNTGISQKEIEKEMVDLSMPAPTKASPKKATQKKVAKKVTKKKIAQSAVKSSAKASK